MNESSRNSLEQQEAMYALQSVKKVREEDTSEDYFIQVKRLPAMVLTNGLGHSLAFLRSKAANKSADKSGHRALFDDIAGWLQEIEVYPSEGEIMEHIMKGSMNKYLEAQSHVMRLLTWLVRFANAYLESGEED